MTQSGQDDVHKLLAAAGIFLIVTASTFPVVLSFLLIDDVAMARNLSRAIALAMLFFGGLALGRFAGCGSWRAGLLMMVYALLGSSRVLSVSSTATLAILTATQLGLVVPDGDAAKLVTATATLALLVGGMLLLARLLKLGFVANFISLPVLTGFKAGIGIVIVLDQAPKLIGVHIAKHGVFADLATLAQQVPETSMITPAVALATFALLIAMERLWPHSPAPLVAV